MKKVRAKLVLKNLTPDQRLVRQQICSDFVKRSDEEPEMMGNIITCNTDIETRQQSMHWKISASPRIKK